MIERGTKGFYGVLMKEYLASCDSFLHAPPNPKQYITVLKIVRLSQWGVITIFFSVFSENIASNAYSWNNRETRNES